MRHPPQQKQAAGIKKFTNEVQDQVGQQSKVDKRSEKRVVIHQITERFRC